jgi:hypothetical protein
VEGLTRKRRNLASDADAPRDGASGARAVKRVPDQRMAPVGKMNPNLMRSAGGQTAFEAGCLRVKRLLDAIARVRRFAPAFPDDGHLFAVGGAAADVAGDLAAARSRHTPHERRIGPVDPAQGKVARQRLVGGLGLGDDHQPAGVLVEAVHDAWPPNPADSAEARAAMADQGVDEGAVRVSWCGMHNQPFGLVDDDQMFILEADLQRHWLGDRDRVAILGQNYDEILAVADPSRRILQRCTRACDVAGFDQPLDPGPRQHRETQRKHAIEAHTGLVRAGTDRRRDGGGRRFSSHASAGDQGAYCRRNHFISKYGLEWMRTLKVLVVVMGIMLIGGFAVLVAVIAGRLSYKGGAPRSFAAAIDIPRGARIEAMAAGADRLVLDVVLPEGSRQLLVIDLTTGARLGIVELRTTP